MKRERAGSHPALLKLWDHDFPKLIRFYPAFAAGHLVAEVIAQVSLALAFLLRHAGSLVRFLFGAKVQPTYLAAAFLFYGLRVFRHIFHLLSCNYYTIVEIQCQDS